jgi:two-component system response regulator NreC
LQKIITKEAGMIEIVLADDNRIVRQGVRALLESEPDFYILAEAKDGLETVRMVERFHPDVLLLDLIMPEMNGLEVTRVVRKRFPKTNVVILSMHANEAYVLEALQAGAQGYVIKDSSSEELVRAIRKVAAGRRYLGPPLSEEMIEAYRKRASG